MKKLELLCVHQTGTLKLTRNILYLQYACNHSFLYKSANKMQNMVILHTLFNCYNHIRKILCRYLGIYNNYVKILDINFDRFLGNHKLKTYYIIIYA